MYYVLSAVMGYLIGSLNFGVIVSKLIYKKDIREHGSGNAGATNALRVLGKAAGALVLLLDAGKSILFMKGFQYLFADAPEPVLLFGALSVIIGHIFPLYFKFKGGKGVSSTVGAILALQPAALLFLVPVFFLVLLIGRKVALSSIVSEAVMPFVIVGVRIYGDLPYVWQYGVVSAMIALIVIYAHRENIRAMRNHETLNVEKKQ